MHKRLYILLSLLFIFGSIRLIAQTFPVVSTTQIIPPYSVYLSDYASASSDKLIAHLMLQDQNQSGIQVKLKITVTGDNGVKLQTKPEFLPPPITLYAGSPEQISGTALQDYLEPANLNITGLNYNQFMRDKKLPEGIYQFTVEAVEYRRTKAVSNPGTAVGWLILNDPPVWNLPQHNSTINASNPQNIFFSWFPMHGASPNSAFTVEYEFSLYDLIPQNANPDEYVNIAAPIHQSSTMSNSLVYGPAEIPLEPGRKYAARLRAYDTEGRDMFKNEGYSDVLVFTYGQQCLTPVGISHDGITPHSANISWTAIPGNTEFQLYYREKTSDPNAQWYVGSTAQTTAVITQLKPLHSYQYVLRALCGTLESEPSAIYEFSTTEKISDTLNCDGNTNVPAIDGSPPLEELLVGDVINVGGFEGVITQARGGNGVFSGKCIMRVTNFNILLKSHFKDIHINQSYQVTQGHVVADRGPGIMINLDEIITTLDSLANLPTDSIMDNPNDYLEDLEIIYDIDPVIVTDSIAEDLEEIKDDLEELASSEELTEEQQQEIEDLLKQIDNLLNGGSQSEDNPSFVMFKAHPNQQYGFDKPDSTASLLQYYRPPNTINGKEQLIRWKSVKANGGTDQVYARLDSVNPNLKFYTAAGTEIIAQNGPADTLKIINITGGQASLNGETSEQIFAKTEPDDSTSLDVGILNIISYTEQEKKLVLVPVNGNSLPAGMSEMQFMQGLNKIYGQAVVKWTHSHTHEGIHFDYAQTDSVEGFNARPVSGQQYSPDMQALIAQFMQNSDFDPESYYIFLLNNPETPEQLGLMPFFQNFAFIFVDKLPQSELFVKTLAHEIGHGAFGLLHPFKQHEGIDEFAYENLMTYHPSATRLYAYQWNLIQYPQQFLDVDYGAADDAGMVSAKKKYYITVENKNAFEINEDELILNSNEIYNYLTNGGDLNEYNFLTKEIYVVATDKNDYTLSTNCYNSKNKKIKSNIYWDQNQKNEETISFQSNHFTKSEYAVIYYQVNEYILPVYKIQLVRVNPNIAFKLNNFEDYIIKEDKYGTLINEINLYSTSVSIKPIFLTKQEENSEIEDLSDIYLRNDYCKYLIDKIKFNNEDKTITMEWESYPLNSSASNYIIETGGIKAEGIINTISDPPYVTVERSKNNFETNYYIEDFYNTALYYPQYPFIRKNNNGTFPVNDFLYQVPIVHYKNSTNVKLLLSSAFEIESPIQYRIGGLGLTVMLGQEFSIPTQPHGTKLDILDLDNEIKGQIEFRQITESLLSPTLNFVTINTDETSIDFATVIEDINKIYATMNVNWLQGNQIILNGINIEKPWGSNMNIDPILNALLAYEEYDEKQYYMIIASGGDDFGGFSNWNLDCNWFIHQKSYSNRIPAHELGHCNGLDEFAVNIGNLPAERRNEANYDAFQKQSTNIMGYNKKNGNDFYSWQIPIVRAKINKRINSGQ